MVSRTTPTTASPRATLDDLCREEGKAELIGGRVVRFMSSGDLPSVVAGEIAFWLREYAKTHGGIAYTGGIVFAVPQLPFGRESFSPDASYYAGPRPASRMRFIEGPPTLAVEVRSENDYGPSAEREIADKRTDYFAAGTLVVWDVDPIAETITAFRADAPNRPTLHRRGDAEADAAEPAMPGWRLPVDDVFGG